MASYKKLLIILAILLVIFLIGCKKGTTVTITEDSKVEQEQTSASKGCKSFTQPSNVQLIASDSWYNNCVSQSSGSSGQEICTASHETSKAILSNDLAKFKTLSYGFLDLQHFAVINEKPELCDEGRVPTLMKTLCKAAASRDKSVCSTISDTDARLNCEAFATRDPSICETISSQATRNGCKIGACLYE